MDRADCHLVMGAARRQWQFAFDTYFSQAAVRILSYGTAAQTAVLHDQQRDFMNRMGDANLLGVEAVRAQFDAWPRS